MKQLHILNGDSSFEQFDQTSLKGEVLIWREILCEGQTTVEVHSEEFWKTRQQFLENYTDQFDPEQWSQFKHRVQNMDFGNFQELILWFEYDLFCQVNLLAVLSWIHHKLGNADTKVSLICLGEHPNYKKLVGLGEIKVEEFAALYPQRKQLSRSDLAFGDQVWKVYCSGQHERLVELIATAESENFEYLAMAFSQHQKRFPSTANGLNEIESKVVNLIAQEAKSKRQLIGELLRTQEVYGFGDLQYAKYIEQLEPIVEERQGQLFIKPLGQQIVQQDSNFKEFRKTNNPFGGAKLFDFSWNESKQTLERRSGL